MLADLVRRSIRESRLGVRAHSALVANDVDVVAGVIERDGHTCQRCGYRIRNAMEIDHLAGHRPCGADRLAAICQFCHNLRHPLWAGARKRIVPIHAPDISQVDITRMAWTLLAWRSVEGAPIDVAETLKLVSRRREEFTRRMGCKDAECLFEAVFAISSDPMVGDKRAARVIDDIDAATRYWPAELLPEHAGLDPAARLSTWTLGGFRVIAATCARSIRGDKVHDFDRLRRAIDASLAA